MRYGSVCSGIEAASHAWEPLGFTPMWFSEIAPFPSKFLKHRFPGVPNHGSLVGLADRLAGGDRLIDILVGGTPCQSFSIAGLRGGLADERGNLALEFARLAAALRPRWLVWENVPGVLSADGGRAFGSLIGALVELGYGLAWRVLDAQFFGVAQRRERVFVVGHLGAAAAAGAVLFEPEGVRRNPPARRKTGEDVAGALGSGSGGFGGDLDRCGAFIPEVARTLRAQAQDPHAEDLGTYIEVSTGNGVVTKDLAPALTRSALGKSVNNDTPLLLSSFDETQVTNPNNRSSCDPATAALTKSGRPPSIAFSITPEGGQGADLEIDTAPALTATAEARSTDRGVRVVCATGEVTHALRSVGADASEDGTGRGTPIVNTSTRVRRLTPRECERLQSFPDDATLIPGAKDSPRYAALGNSMNVKVMRWIGERIAKVDALLKEAA